MDIIKELYEKYADELNMPAEQNEEYKEAEANLHDIIKSTGIDKETAERIEDCVGDLVMITADQLGMSGMKLGARLGASLTAQDCGPALRELFLLLYPELDIAMQNDKEYREAEAKFDKELTILKNSAGFDETSGMAERTSAALIMKASEKMFLTGFRIGAELILEILK